MFVNKATNTSSLLFSHHSHISAALSDVNHCQLRHSIFKTATEHTKLKLYNISKVQNTNSEDNKNIKIIQILTQFETSLQFIL